MSAGAKPGTLYVVATPIGNLEDITYRAARVLGEVALIACEDTRHSQKLLVHYGIRRPVISLYRENEAQRAGELVSRMEAGEDVALITDAGAPTLSDPGARLVERAVAAGLRVTPLPGPSAPVAALMASGSDAPATFAGFLPSRTGERQRWLQGWRARGSGNLVVFEAPHRLLAALADMAEVLGPERRLVVARELTKLHEEFIRGTVAEVQQRFAAQAPQGEFTLVVLAADPAAQQAAARARADQDLAPGMSRDELKRLARATGMGKSELYRRMQQLRGKIKD
ncbi:MAG TPA: 16S rRNA (cytidine(1402)-2'-O)-methyltransferase [Terriglobales bacterium]|nr:16S rRNA (cytidine(1402)-2'-O)-methyltransferase [Terriglobales bacterium]